MHHVESMITFGLPGNKADGMSQPYAVDYAIPSGSFLTVEVALWSVFHLIAGKSLRK